MLMHMRKGLSPFIAMALLVAIVVAVAAVFGHWIGPFAEQQTEVVENATAQVHSCTDIHIDILDAHYAEGEVQITVMNAGFAELPDLTVVVLGEGAVINQANLGDMRSGEIMSEQVEIEAGVPERIVAVSPICPMITDEKSL